MVGTDTNLITVAEFTAAAPEVDLSKYETTTVSGFIGKASKEATDYLQYTPLQETITDEQKNAVITNEGDLLIFPNKPPVQSVSAIAILKGATVINLNLKSGDDIDKFNIDFTKRNIRYPAGELTLQGVPIFTNFYGMRGSQFYTQITYVGGFLESELPDTITQAVVLLTREILSRSQNTSGAEEISQGGLRLKFSSRRGGESDLVVDAKKLLNPYKRIG